MFAEAKAILEGILHAKRLGFPSVWVESDLLVLINVMKEIVDTPWSILYNVRDIRSLLRDFQEMRIPVEKETLSMA